jgi:hypothetical protein
MKRGANIKIDVKYDVFEEHIFSLSNTLIGQLLLQVGGGGGGGG